MTLSEHTQLNVMNKLYNRETILRLRDTVESASKINNA